MSTPLSVFVIENNPLAAEYMLHILQSDTMLSARWLQNKLPQQNELRPDTVFILDKVGLEGTISEYIRILNARTQNPRYIVLDTQLERQSLFQLLSVGVHGFLLHHEVEKTLRLAILSVWDGRMWIDSRVFQDYTSASMRTRQCRLAKVDDEAMTLRESEILHLVRQRLSNKEIAAILSIEVSTVKFHLSNVFAKLRIASRSDLWQNSTLDSSVLGSSYQSRPSLTAEKPNVQGLKAAV